METSKFLNKRRFQRFVARLKPFVTSLFRRADDGNRNTTTIVETVRRVSTVRSNSNSTRSLWETSVIQTLDYFLVLIGQRRPYHKNRPIFIFNLFMDLFWFSWIVRELSCCLFQFNIRSLWVVFHNPDCGFAEQLHLSPTGLSWSNSSLVMSTW